MLHDRFLPQKILMAARLADNLPGHTVVTIQEVEGREKRRRDQALATRNNGPVTTISFYPKFS